MTKTTDLINLKIDKLAGKNNIFTAGFVLFKSTLSVGLLLSPQYFIKGGLVLSIFLTILITLLVSYGIYLVAKVSNQIEESSNYKIKLKNFDELCFYVGGNIMKYVTQVSNLLFNLLIFWVNMINGVNYWQNIFEEINSKIFNIKINDHHVLIVILWMLIYAVWIILIKKPETLKFTSFISGIVMLLLVVILWFMNISFTYTQTTSYNFSYFNFSQFNYFIGNMLFTLESVGTIFTVRLGMRNPKRLPNLILTVFIFITFLIILQGSTFLLGFGDENIKISSFDYYTDNFIIFILKVLFYLTLPIVMVIYVICNMTIIEETKIYKRVFKKDKWIVKCSWRILYMIITCLPVFFTRNEGFIMLLGGCTVSPILGFVVPILIDNIYNKNRMTKFNKIFNWVILAVCLTLNFYSLFMNLYN